MLEQRIDAGQAEPCALCETRDFLASRVCWPRGSTRLRPAITDTSGTCGYVGFRKDRCIPRSGQKPNSQEAQSTPTPAPGTLPGTMGRQRRARKPRFRIYLAFSCGEVAEWPKAAVCQGCQESENGPEIDDFRPVFYWDVGWPWLPNDGPWTKFGHTGGHTGVDANVCLTGTRCGTVAK